MPLPWSQILGHVSVFPNTYILKYSINSGHQTLSLHRIGSFPYEYFKDQEPPNLIRKAMEKLILLALKFVSAGSQAMRSPDNQDLLCANTS